MHAEIKKLSSQAQKYAKELEELSDQISKVIVGQDKVVHRLIIALLADGHVLLEGAPGLAKTLMVRTLAQTLKADFKRIQFTPDLLPADITGTKIYDHKTAKFSTVKGPIFNNIILADEINRAPPKVQSALLEAMQERQVTIQGESYELPKPFLVLATMNPIEHEGVYMLPEAQVDRFMFKLIVDYPSLKEEQEIIARNTTNAYAQAKEVLSPHKIEEMHVLCREIYADEKIHQYVARLVDATRHPENYKMELKEIIEYGASPRASIWLILAAKAHALMQGRGYVLPEDVQECAHDVLRHRIILTYAAIADGKTPDEIIELIISKVKVP